VEGASISRQITREALLASRKLSATRSTGGVADGRQAGRHDSPTNTQEPQMTNLYPFVTKNQIKTRLTESPAFRCEAMAILHTLQTEFEQGTRSTRDKNRQGFMSSHAVNGSRVAEKIKAGAELTAEDWEHIDRIAPRYTRQLALVLRARQLVEQPELAAVAKLFSADVSGASTADVPPTETDTVDAAAELN